MNVKLSKVKKTRILNATDVAGMMQHVLLRESKIGRAQEHFWTIGLSNSNKILFIELIGLGRQNRLTANPPDVFRMAVYKQALKIIMVHNHPSGQMKPSRADRAVTDHMLKVGEILNIDVLDHIIISETRFFSFNDAGIMDRLRKTNTWRPHAKDKYIQQIQLDIEKMRAQKKRELEIAAKLKEDGMLLPKIKKITGLTMAAITVL